MNQNKTFIISMLLAAVVALSGCTPPIRDGAPGDLSTSPVSGKPLNRVEKFKVEDRLLEPCKAATKLTEGQPVYSEEVLAAYGKTSNNLKECSEKQQKLTEAICKSLASASYYCTKK